MSIEDGSDAPFGRIAELKIPPLEYYGLVRHFNDLIQTELSNKLKSHAGRLGVAATLITPGSDGRREKGSLASPLEVIAVMNADIDPNVFEKTLASVLQQMSSTRISEVREIKRPGSTLSFFKDDPKRVQPGRIADSRLLYGSEENMRNIKNRLGEEIVRMPYHNIAEKVSQLKKSGRQATEKGRNRFGGEDVVHFDLQNGIAYFNPEAHRLSFKIGPLRLVQNGLLLEEIKHTRREGDRNFISTLSSGIVKRLAQLSDDRMLNLTRASVEELMEHYAFFLRLYHRSEEEYVQHGLSALQLNLKEVDEVARRLQSLLQLMRKLKIQKQPR